MNEEPRIAEALNKLMVMLDKEVQTALIGKPNWKNLDKEVVAEAQAVAGLSQSRVGALQAKNKARENTANAIREWLNAVDNLSRSESPN